MPTRPIVHLLCPAKVNLALSVGAPVDTSRGSLHPIASWMVAVDFGDVLTLERLDGGSAKAGTGAKPAAPVSQFDLSFADDAPVRGVVDWPLEKDLCYRAHQLMERAAGHLLPVKLTLKKRIPAGAGLGGGSSDAAGTIVGLDRLFQLGLGKSRLQDLGATLGSDVAFLVGAALGEPSALVEGLGEKLSALPLAAPIHLVLIFPPFGCPTGPVYKAFDQLGPAAAEPDARRIKTLAGSQPLKAAAPFNDLAEPAFVVAPALRGLAEEIWQKLSCPVHVTGSGSTLFIPTPDGAMAEVVARQASNATGLPTIATRTL